MMVDDSRITLCLHLPRYPNQIQHHNHVIIKQGCKRILSATHEGGKGTGTGRLVHRQEIVVRQQDNVLSTSQIHRGQLN